MIVSGALNVGLNLLFVIVFQLDVAGVAIATAVSQLLSAVLVAIRLCTIDSICRLDLRKVRFYPDKALLMLKIGLSAGIQGIIFSIANVMIQSAVNSFGSAVIAGNSAASGLENFIHTAQNTFYQAAITFTSQSLGAKRPRQAVRVFWICMGLTVGLGLVLCVLLRLFQTQLLGIYIKPTDDAYEAVMAAGVVRVLAISQFQWVGGMMETACGSIRGLGKTINPTITTLIGACGLRIVWLYTIFKAVGTIESLYWSYPVSWVLTLAIHIVFLLIYKRQLEARRKEKTPVRRLFDPDSPVMSALSSLMDFFVLSLLTPDVLSAGDHRRSRLGAPCTAPWQTWLPEPLCICRDTSPTSAGSSSRPRNAGCSSWLWRICFSWTSGHRQSALLHPDLLLGGVLFLVFCLLMAAAYSEIARPTRLFPSCSCGRQPWSRASGGCPGLWRSWRPWPSPPWCCSSPTGGSGC